MTNPSVPWVKAYRPTSLEQVAEHKDTITVIDNMIQQDALMNLIFIGPMGVGKSSIAAIISEKLYGTNASMMTLRLNASDSRGINDIRQIIQKFSEVFYEKRRLIILDEADSMTLDAQLALRKIMDNNNKRVNFCLICNYIRKIHPAILSRCVMFHFNPVQELIMADRLKLIVDKENKHVDDDVLIELAKLCKGDMRQAVHLLYSLSFKENITVRDVYYFTGNILLEHIAEIHGLLNDINRTSFKDTYYALQTLMKDNGYHLYQIVEVIGSYIRKIKKFHFLPKLADIETRLAYDFSEDVQLAGIISLFVE